MPSFRAGPLVAAVLIVTATTASAQTITFGDFAAANGSASFLNATTLQLTPDAGGQSGSAFAAAPQAVGNFTAAFTYRPTYGGNNPADGAAFVLHNDPASVTALGTAGSGLGYVGIANSAAVALSVYDPGQSNISASRGARFTRSGVSSEYAQVGYYGPAPGLVQSGVGTAVTLAYSDGQLRATVAGVTRRFEVDLGAIVGGPTAYVGFTGATGGATAQQQVEGFAYTAGAAAAASTRGWRLQQSFLATIAGAANAANSGGGANPVQIENTQEAVDLANGTGGFLAAHRTTVEIVDAVNNGFENGGWPVNGDNADFAAKWSGYAKNVAGTSGTYTLYANSDDGFRLDINGVTVAEFAGLTGGSDTTIPNVTINDGDLLEFYFAERDGGDFATLRLNNANGPLIGATESGIEIYITPVPVPEPGIWAVPLAAGLALAGRRLTGRG